MNVLFLNFIKESVINFIKYATEQDCNLVVPHGYRTGFYDYILSLRNKGGNKEDTQADENIIPIKFISQFPEQAEQLPVISFALGNLSTPVEIQSQSYETEELTDSEYSAYRHLSSTLVGKDVKYIQTKNYITTTQVIIGVYANNKLEVCWLMYLVDFIIHFRAEDLSVIGILDVSTQETDLRLRQELFPLAVPTRILTANFKYETIIPRVEHTKAYFGGDLHFTLEEEPHPLADSLDLKLLI